MKKILLGLLSVLCVPFLLSLPSYAHDSEPTPDHISVVGVGEIQQEPDQAILNISINAKRPNLVDAKRLADDRYQRVLSVIGDARIDKKFVKATRINAQPQYEWQNSKRIYKGELVSRSLSITINDLEKVSPLMQALVENEVSTIDGMTTGFKDRKALQQKALAAAADDARNKAKFLAERLGRSLGSAYLIMENNSNAPQVYQRNIRVATEMSAMKSTSAPPEMFGEQTVSVSVSVSFNLL